MKVSGLGWVGSRTSAYPAMVAFLKDVFHLEPSIEQADFAVFRLANGDTVEVFGGNDEYHQHFTTGPVVGFRVDDVPPLRPRWRQRGSSSSAVPKPHQTATPGRTSERRTGMSTRS